MKHSSFSDSVNEHCFWHKPKNKHYTPRIFPCSVPALKIHTWIKLNLSMKEVVWTSCLQLFKWHNHTRCSISRACSKETQAQFFLQKSNLIALKIDGRWNENQSVFVTSEWIILRLTGWPQSFCQQSTTGKFTPSIFSCSVTELKVLTLSKLNFPRRMWC